MAKPYTQADIDNFYREERRIKGLTQASKLVKKSKTATKRLAKELSERHRPGRK